MAALGELAQQYEDVFIQTHLSENHDEIAWVKTLYPECEDYLAVYETATGNWYIRSLGPVGPYNPPICFGQNWGNASTDPVSGDYDGDGSDDLAVYQRIGGKWYIRSLGNPSAPAIAFDEKWGW